MDSRIFLDAPMDLRKRLTGLPFDSRFSYDPEKNVLYLNFERLAVKTPERVEAIFAKIWSICGPLGKRVHAVVNYEGFVLDSDVEERFTETVSEAVQRWYLSVTRFTTSAFMRAKLGEALSRRKLAPYIFETEPEALASLHGTHGGVRND